MDTDSFMLFPVLLNFKISGYVFNMAESKGKIFDADDLEEYFYFENSEDRESESDSDSEDVDEDIDDQETREIELLREYVHQNQIAGYADNRNDEEQVVHDDDAVVDGDNVPGAELVVAEAAGEQPVAPPLDIKYLSGCKCTVFCGQFLDNDYIQKMRDCYDGMCKESHDMVILGQIAATINRSQLTNKASHKAKQRRRDRCNYAIEGKLHTAYRPFI